MSDTRKTELPVSPPESQSDPVPRPGPPEVPSSSKVRQGRHRRKDRRLTYMPWMDGLRAVAIGMVLLFHIAESIFRGGWAGVDVFFAISGFLITSLLLQEYDRTGRLSLIRFYVHRVIRLGPAFWVFLATFVLVEYIGHRTQIGRAYHEVLLAVSYRANLRDMHGAAQVDGISQIWTLCLEEQFYLVWPFALWILCRAGRKAALIVTCIAAAASFILSVVLSADGATAARVRFGPDTGAFALLVGCAAGMLYIWGYCSSLSGASVKGGRMAVICFVAIGAVLLGVGTGNPWVYTGPRLAASGGAAVMVVAMAIGSGGWLKALLSRKLMVWVGKLSYSIYLWNSFFLGRNTMHPYVLRVVVGLAETLIAATLSFYVVERSGRRFRTWLDRQKISRPRRAPAPVGSLARVAEGDLRV